MFEALFILTTVDAGTRVGRYILQDFLGHVWKPLGDTRNLRANLAASGLMVAGWGYFLIQGVRDPLGGINSLWPLFGIANQMLAALALCLATTIILKMVLQKSSAGVPPAAHETKYAPFAAGTAALRSPWPALITLIPLIWLVAVTFTAGVEKIFHPDPRIGFLAQAQTLAGKTPGLQKALDSANATGDVTAIDAAQKALHANSTLRFNNLLDAAVAGIFLALVTVIVLLSLREWFLLLSRRKPAVLHETEPVWLPDYAVVEGGRKFSGAAGAAALALALAKEWSGESHLERAHQCECSRVCENADFPRTHVRGHDKTAQQVYVEVTEQRFNGVRRCC
jgi:carbon starvation protein